MVDAAGDAHPRSAQTSTLNHNAPLTPKGTPYVLFLRSLLLPLRSVLLAHLRAEAQARLSPVRTGALRPRYKSALRPAVGGLV